MKRSAESPAGDGNPVLSPGRHNRQAPELGPRKRPRQDRSKETVAAILQAAAELIGDEGFARTTTNRIADRAGVSVGSLYQYFPNKDAIFARLLECHQQTAHTVVDRAVARLADTQVRFAEALRGLFIDLIEMHDSDPKLHRALTADVPPALGSVVRHAHEDECYVRRTEEVLRGRPDVRVNDAAIAAQVLVQATSALSRWLVHEAPPSLDRHTFVDEAVRMLAGYAGAE